MNFNISKIVYWTVLVLAHAHLNGLSIKTKTPFASLPLIGLVGQLTTVS